MSLSEVVFEVLRAIPLLAIGAAVFRNSRVTEYLASEVRALRGSVERVGVHAEAAKDEAEKAYAAGAGVHAIMRQAAAERAIAPKSRPSVGSWPGEGAPDSGRGLKAVASARDSASDG